MSENVKPWDLPDKVIERVTANEMLAMLRGRINNGYMPSATGEVKYNSKPEYIRGGPDQWKVHIGALTRVLEPPFTLRLTPLIYIRQLQKALVSTYRKGLYHGRLPGKLSFIKAWMDYNRYNTMVENITKLEAASFSTEFLPLSYRFGSLFHNKLLCGSNSGKSMPRSYYLSMTQLGYLNTLYNEESNRLKESFAINNAFKTQNN